jgi:transcription termination factor Rho
VDLVAPIGMGQRGLIVSPPRAGKTILLQQLAKATLKNHPDVRDRAVDRRAAGRSHRHGASGEGPQLRGDQQHVRRTAEPAYPGGRNGDREGQADGRIRPGRGHLSSIRSPVWPARGTPSVPHSGKILSGGVDANALQHPKRFFGAARNVEEGGSLTIIATALVDTGSKMDEVIFEEFKGTGNTELHLDRRMVEKRVWPAIDVNRSGTRREELLMNEEELKRVWILRRVLNDMNPVEAMELLTNRMRRTKSNEEFLISQAVTTESATYTKTLSSSPFSPS